VECAKVLLRNGANASVNGGWDGGCHVPLHQSSDYWYTSSNTPLHQAARGNHVEIIHLILNGPDKESIHYAAEKGIDLSGTWVADIEDNSPSMEFYDDDTGDTESADLTPLAMALMFGNFEAAIALLLHGARLPMFGAPDGVARRVVYTALFKKKEQFKAVFDAMKADDEGKMKSVVDQFFSSLKNSEDASDDDYYDEDETAEYKVILYSDYWYLL